MGMVMVTIEVSFPERNSRSLLIDQGLHASLQASIETIFLSKLSPPQVLTPSSPYSPTCALSFRFVLSIHTQLS